jgi:hypothetical protein
MFGLCTRPITLSNTFTMIPQLLHLLLLSRVEIPFICIFPHISFWRVEWRFLSLLSLLTYIRRAKWSGDSFHFQLAHALFHLLLYYTGHVPRDLLTAGLCVIWTIYTPPPPLYNPPLNNNIHCRRLSSNRRLSLHWTFLQRFKPPTPFNNHTHFLKHTRLEVLTLSQH